MAFGMNKISIGNVDMPRRKTIGAVQGAAQPVATQPAPQPAPQPQATRPQIPQTQPPANTRQVDQGELDSRFGGQEGPVSARLGGTLGDIVDEGKDLVDRNTDDVTAAGVGSLAGGPWGAAAGWGLNEMREWYASQRRGEEGGGNADPQSSGGGGNGLFNSIPNIADNVTGAIEDAQQTEYWRGQGDEAAARTSGGLDGTAPLHEATVQNGGDNPAMNDIQEYVTDQSHYAEYSRLPGAMQNGVFIGSDGLPHVPPNLPDRNDPGFPAAIAMIEAEGAHYIPPEALVSPVNEAYDAATGFLNGAKAPWEGAAAGSQAAMDQAIADMNNPLNSNDFMLDGGEDVQANAWRGGKLNAMSNATPLAQYKGEYNYLQGLLNKSATGQDDLFNKARESAMFDYNNNMRTDRDMNIRGQTQAGLGGSSLAAASNKNFDMAAQNELNMEELKWASADRTHRQEAMKQMGDNLQNMTTAELDQFASQIDAATAYSEQMQEAARLDLDADKANQEDDRMRDIESMKNKVQIELDNRQAPLRASEVAANQARVAGVGGDLADSSTRHGSARSSTEQENNRLLFDIAKEQDPTAKLNRILENAALVAEIESRATQDGIAATQGWLSAQTQMARDSLEFQQLWASLEMTLFGEGE